MYLKKIKPAQVLPRAEAPMADRCPCHVPLCALFFSLWWLRSPQGSTVIPARLEAREGRGCVPCTFCPATGRLRCTSYRAKLSLHFPYINSFNLHSDPGM